MAEYHIGACLFGIYVGTLNKAKTMWQNKTECTDEAINAVRDYMVDELLGGVDCKKAIKSGYEWTLEDGKIVKLLVEIQNVEKMKQTDWIPAAERVPETENKVLCCRSRMKGAEMIEITKDEAESLADFIEVNIFDIIRNDPDIDSIEWLENLMAVYKKCKTGEKND